MKNAGISVLTMVLVLCLFRVGWSDLVDISIATNKQTYLLGEEVIVYVSAYNPGLDPVTLTFPSGLTASYWIDETYYWHENKIIAPIYLQLNIDPDSTHTWQRIHGLQEMTEYSLAIGTHDVIGIIYALELQTNYMTELLEFEVIPEPGGFIIITTGSLWILRYSRKRSIKYFSGIFHTNTRRHDEM